MRRPTPVRLRPLVTTQMVHTSVHTVGKFLLLLLLLLLINIIIIIIIIIISILDFKFPTSGVTDYVINRNMRRLTAVTVCLWMRSADQTIEGTTFSYAVSEQYNELSLYDYKRFKLTVASNPAQ